MGKPITETMDKHIQFAVAELENVISGHVQNHPKLAQEEKMAALVENSGAFSGIANKIQIGDNQQLAARPVGDMSVATEVQR